ncbi:MAG TPA: substrate-binding domain-containing protein [Rhodocyclaceae bacterium]|nr:substrate-binding domain-containing protein [Rhodocyclaceae bacterium]
MSKPATTSTTAAARVPRLRWTWDFGIELGDVDTRRLLLLLTALLDTSALGKAAAAAGMSYRAAWGLLRHCQEQFGHDLVVMERGRGTRLTPFGESLVEMDGAACAALGEVHALWETRMHGLLAPVLGVPPRLTLHASHDLALADWVEHGRQVPVEVTWRGSEDALAALGRGECDIAGFHVPETWASGQLVLWLKRWLKPSLHVCVPLMRRRQGLIVARGNPLHLRSLADVAARDARMVNRQRGSGTRTLIDQLLAANGIEPGSIHGYGHEEFTHDAVAATVAGGSADAGFGIMAAAARYDLDFVPLVNERYGFALRHAAMDSEAGKAFLRRLAGKTFRQRLSALPGYAPLAIVKATQWEEFLSPDDGKKSKSRRGT